MNELVYMVVRQDHGHIKYGLYESIVLCGVYRTFAQAMSVVATMAGKTSNDLYIYDNKVYDRETGNLVRVPYMKDEFGTYDYTLLMIRVPYGTNPKAIYLGGALYIE